MRGLTKRDWWMAAGLSGFVCGLFGPLVGLAILSGWDLIRNGAVFPVHLLASWRFAVTLFGMPGFILGGFGGLLLKSLAAKCRSTNGVIAVGASIGLALGSAVPLAFCVYEQIVNRWSWNSWNWPLGYIALGAASGAVCGVIMIWLLRSGRLLALPVLPSHI
jgi:hypothetical protein